MTLNQDRVEAAHLLSERLKAYKNTNAVVMSVLNRGVPIGYHIADMLNLQLEIIPCAKLKHPALGIESIGSVCVDETWIKEDTRNIPQDYIYHQVILLQHALKAKCKFYRGNRPAAKLEGRTVIIVDDRVQSGDTMLACIKSIKKQQPERIIMAVPSITTEAAIQVAQEVNKFIYLMMDKTNLHFKSFPLVDDEQVKELLESSILSYQQQ